MPTEKPTIKPRIIQPEGEKRKPFYLPVRRLVDRYAYECWIFPLALPVLGYYIVSDMLWILWKDLFEYLELLRIKKIKRD